MDSGSLHQQIARMRQSLIYEGILEHQFHQLEKLTDEKDPNFVVEMVDTYFEQVTEIIANMEHEMERTLRSCRELEIWLNQLKGSTASIGAKRVKAEAHKLLECCDRKDLVGAKAAFEKLKTEQETLKTRLYPYLELLKKAKAAETATGTAPADTK